LDQLFKPSLRHRLLLKFPPAAGRDAMTKAAGAP
jgi:hypothetical protein